jgi:hypothetical protein
MFAIKIQISKFIDNHPPGFVECTFNDAWGKAHIVQEKIPIVTEKDLSASSEYPQDGVIGCEIVKEWQDKLGNQILTVNTEKPWGVESIEGLTEFDLLKEQIIEIKM